MAKRIPLSLLALFVVAAGAAAQDKDKVTVCHFAGKNAELLSISRNALEAHLAHGDVAAPPSVKTAADCLVPQPPPQPVVATATTDARGNASFTIPSTNVIARLTVRDSTGAPVAGAATEMMVIGDDFLVVAVDSNRRLSPAFAEGKLSAARPGSALQVAPTVVLPPVTSTFQGGTILQNPPPPPPFITNHFVVREYCFTQEGFKQFLELMCDATLHAGVHLVLDWTGAGHALVVLASVVASIPLGTVCGNFAEQAAAASFAGTTLPLKIRVYSPPSGLTPNIMPIYATEIGTCGGSCCVAGGPQCALVTDAGACQGTYRPNVPCVGNPCPTGACCDNTGCNETSPDACRARGGTYRGDGSKCTPDPCKKGACCEAGSCSVISESECKARGGNYQGDDTTCTSNPCVKGACCDPRTGCSVLSDIECRNRGGTFHGNNTTCDRISSPTPLRYTLQSGGGTGGAGFPIPVTHGTIRTTVTIPGNIINGQCQRDWRVEVRVCPLNAGCQGGNFYAGEQFNICHANPETITFQQLNPGTPCSNYSINALTGGVSQIVVEILPP